MIIPKAAIQNLAVVLTGMDVEEVELGAGPMSGRPFVVVGPKNEYGHAPRLVMDDVGKWNYDGAPWGEPDGQEATR